jgi:predicted Zn-dependent protease
VTAARAAGLAAVAALLAACQSVPGGGRSQLILVDDSLLAREAGAAFAQMPRARDEAALGRLRSVARKVVAAARACPVFGDPSLPPPERWEIILVDDPTPNAFAMPGGRIGVHRGMLPLLPTDADLATVLSHEVAHVACRHGAERVSHSLLAALGAVAVDQAMADKPSARRQEVLAAYGAAATLGVLLPYSREHENEADRIGLAYMARAGYDPAAAVGFWRRFAAGKAGGAPEFLSTHPSDSTRVRKLEALLPEARRTYLEVLAAQRASTPSTGASR